MSEPAPHLARAPVDVQDQGDGLALPEVAFAQTLAGRRRAEHIAGRRAARAALLALLGPNTAWIERASDGAPEVRGITPAPRLSISHGHTEAVAAAGFVELLGVDLCDLADAPRVQRVATRFLELPERQLIDDDRAASWAALWALKEAAAKALRRGLLDGGLRASRLASLDPPRFAHPLLHAQLWCATSDVVALVYR